MSPFSTPLCLKYDRLRSYSFPNGEERPWVAVLSVEVYEPSAQSAYWLPYNDGNWLDLLSGS